VSMRRLFRAAALLLCATAQGAFAAEISVLSGGAIEPGVRPAIAAFEEASGHTVALSFATAPQIRERVAAGQRFDVLIAPPAVLDALALDAALRVPIGSVGLGVAVRPGATRPDISSAEAFTRALLEADSLVFNRASTGLYFEGLMKKLGLEAATAPKTTRYPDGASVMAHVLHGRGSELGIGAITEIVLVQGKGLQLVGPLPPGLQNLTSYVAAPTQPQPADAVRALLKHLAGADAQATYNAAGITPTR
jgi:molybdate transport system substrate-binding protein